MADTSASSQLRIGRRRLLQAVPAVGAVCLTRSAQAATPPAQPQWTATLAFVDGDGTRHDPTRWSRGDAHLARSVRVCIDDMTSAPRSAPRAIDLDVGCGTHGDAHYLAWTWRAGDEPDPGRSPAFVAPVHRHSGLCLSVRVDDEAPLSVHLHPGNTPGLARLRAGTYELQLHRIDAPSDPTRLRLRLDRA